MKKVIIALSVFAFVFAYSGVTSDASANQVSTYTADFNADKDLTPDGTKKAAKADATKSSCGDKSAKASSSDCSKSCGAKDKSAKASAGDRDTKKSGATTAAVSAPDVK
ncbi:MAG: hypothetical protein K0B15_02880 [Lentimicrobium sp.]|nr:hypothetical protein [Lentimicrobium sp.]